MLHSGSLKEAKFIFFFPINPVFSKLVTED